MEADVTIRMLHVEDAAAFAESMKQFMAGAGDDPPTERELQTLFERALRPESNLVYIVAACDVGLVGMLSLTFGESSYKLAPFAWGDDFYVDERHRRAGIGRRLIERAVEIAAERGCSNVLVGVGRDESDAQAFYAATGFVDLRCNLLSHQIDAPPMS